MNVITSNSLAGFIHSTIIRGFPIKNRKILIWLLLVILLLFVSNCVPGDGSSTSGDPSGFFSGIWHGWIAPVLLIWGYFNDSIRLYEKFNTGWWYDFGFYIALIGGFGGISFIRRKSKKGGKHENKQEDNSSVSGNNSCYNYCIPMII